MSAPQPRQVLPGDSGTALASLDSVSRHPVDRSGDGIARVAINRPFRRNAFRPRTVAELCDAFARIRDDSSIGVVLFTGVGPAEDGGYAFCAGGDRSMFAAMGAMWTRRGCPASMCWISSA